MSCILNCYWQHTILSNLDQCLVPMMNIKMKIKKKKSAMLLISALVIFFGLDLSINAKDLNVFQGQAAAHPLDLFSRTFVPSFLYLFSIGMVGLAVVGRRGATNVSSAKDRRSLPDHGGRRSKVERRQYQYDYIVPDRRSEKDRRENSDRRTE